MRADRLAGGGVWSEPSGGLDGAASRERVLAPGFCLMASDAQPASPTAALVAAVCAELTERGHRCLTLQGPAVDDPRALGYDVVVHLRGTRRYIVNPRQLHVLWPLAPIEALADAERNLYDLVFPAQSAREDAAAIAGRLLDATLARMREIGFATRIPSEHGPSGEH